MAERRILETKLTRNEHVFIEIIALGTASKSDERFLPLAETRRRFDGGGNIVASVKSGKAVVEPKPGDVDNIENDVGKIESDVGKTEKDVDEDVDDIEKDVEDIESAVDVTDQSVEVVLPMFQVVDTVKTGRVELISVPSSVVSVGKT